MIKSTLRSPDGSSCSSGSSPAISVAPWTFRAGDVLAEKYLLVRPLGAGSMGQVWVARNSATDAEVAVKVLLPERAGADDAFERFRREAHAMSRLSHRGIVRAFDLVELDPAKGSLLLVMELLRGQTLAHRIESAGRLSVTETVQIALPLLSALEHAHTGGVVHRDLKPDNIFLAVEPDGQILPKLVDFGISKMRHEGVLTKRGALVGSPCYMAPEQARGDEVDARSDVFSLGIVLYECLAGRPPFSGDTLYATVKSVIETEPPVLDDIPVDLWSVVARALAKRPDDRYASAGDLSKAIVAAVPGFHATLRSVPPGPTSLTLPPAVSRTTTTLAEIPARSRRALVLGAGGLGCVAVFGLAAALRPFRHPEAPVAVAASQSAGADARPVAPQAPLAPPTARVPVAAPPVAPPVTPPAPARPRPAEGPAARRPARAAADAGATVDAPSAPEAPPPPPSTMVSDPGF